MDGELRGQFFTAMTRFKKMETVFSSGCESPVNELAILQSITGGCGCDECGSMNLNVPEIQERLQITKPAVSYILNTLEKKGHIVRDIDPKDRRKISITATPEGKAFAEVSSQRFEEIWSLLLSHFGEERMRLLVELLLELTCLCEGLCRDEKTNP